MQHFIAVRRHMARPHPRLSLGILEDRAEEWQRKARTLRLRRERLLKQRMHMHYP